MILRFLKLRPPRENPVAAVFSIQENGGDESATESQVMGSCYEVPLHTFFSSQINPSPPLELLRTTSRPSRNNDGPLGTDFFR